MDSKPRIIGGRVDIGAYETALFRTDSAFITQASSPTASDGTIRIEIQGGSAQRLGLQVGDLPTGVYRLVWRGGAVGVVVQ